jgi:hypothetical protein
MILDNQTIMMVVVVIILGMLVSNMIKEVCECKVVEGQTAERGFVHAADPVFDECTDLMNCQWLPGSRSNISSEPRLMCGELSATTSVNNPCSTENQMQIIGTGTNDESESDNFGTRNFANVAERFGTTLGGFWSESVCCGKPIMSQTQLVDGCITTSIPWSWRTPRTSRCGTATATWVTPTEGIRDKCILECGTDDTSEICAHCCNG